MILEIVAFYIIVISASYFLISEINIFGIKNRAILETQQTPNLSITEKTFIILNKNTQNNNYYFIKVPSSYHRGVKNYKLLYFRNSSTINIRDDLVDTDKIQLKTEILLELEKYKDLILNAIINFDSKKVAPKNKKLAKKLKK